MLRTSLLLLICSITLGGSPASADSFRSMLRAAQEKVVKVYGAGGLQQLESYQTGIFISPEGHVLTSLSYVLDTDELAVVLDSGARYEAEFLASDPLLELALLKLPLDTPAPYFDLSAKSSVEVGERVLALSNLYGIAAGDEPVSVLQGVVTAIAPLSARRGRFQANYRGKVYLIDANSNNPGAAGGALINWQGQLLGVLGKELRSEITGGWLHYAIPVEAFSKVVAEMQAGRDARRNKIDLLAPDEPQSAAALGLIMVPEVLPRTPPYVDSIRRNSPAAVAGVQPDDLVVFVNADPTPSCRAVHEALAFLEQDEPVRLSVLRNGELKEFQLEYRDSAAPAENGDNQQPRRSTLEFVEPE